MSETRVAVPGGEAEEQEDGGVGEQHVPFQRHRERERRDDEQVEHDHDHRGDHASATGSCENSSTSGAMISTTVPGTCAMNVGEVRRPQVVREVAVVRPLEPLERHRRAVADHRRDRRWRSACRTSTRPAPTHTTTISSFSAMIMSTNGSAAKKTSAGRYCSPRAARKMVLSRNPITTSSTMGAISSAGIDQSRRVAGHRGRE